MPRVPITIPLGFYQSKSTPLSSQNCINWIPTIPQAEALNDRALMQREGLKQFAQTNNGACRGGWVVNGVPYFVNGTTLSSISRLGVVTNHGTITGTNRVSMADNGTFLVIVVPGGSGFVFDVTTNTLTQITDPDYQTADTVKFFGGYFVFTATDGKQLFISNLNQPLVFDALDFGSAEGDPDRIVSQVVTQDELSILGSETTEVFRDVGGSGFPLQVVQGALTQKGVFSKYGVIEFNNKYAFVGGGKNELTAILQQTSSASARKISTDAIDNAIQKFTDEEIADCFAMTYSSGGQILALFTFPSTRIASRTFVYNATTSAIADIPVWFEMQTGVTPNSWRANAIVKAYGKLLVGDAIDGRIGELDVNTFNDYGDPMFRRGVTKPFSQNGNKVFAGEFEATFEAGVGLTTGQGSDPTIRMDFSDDGGRTFSNEFSRSIGKIGEYGHETIWRRQGRFPDARTIGLTITDPVKANLVRLAATPELGVD